jgi:hypothetical protein
VAFVFDSDSEGVSFGDPGSASGSCAPSDLAIDGGASDALAAAKSWHMIDNTTIELRDQDGAALMRMIRASNGS